MEIYETYIYAERRSGQIGKKTADIPMIRHDYFSMLNIGRLTCRLLCSAARLHVAVSKGLPPERCAATTGRGPNNPRFGSGVDMRQVKRSISVAIGTRSRLTKGRNHHRASATV